MPKLQVITTNFTAGEFTPLLAGRVDIEKHNSSAKRLQNVVVLKQGGVTIRPPLSFQVETANSAYTSRIVPFVYSATDAYQLEFGELTVRVRRANGTVVESSPGVPYEFTSPYSAAALANLDFSQGDDTIIITHPDIFPRRLRRFSETNWVIDQLPLLPQPVSEVGFTLAVNVSIDVGALGAGRTVTAAGAIFLASDVGREIGWGGGIALITGFTSTTVVTATVTAAFSSLTGYGLPSSGPVWTLTSSPQTTLTPSAASPIGAAITATLSANGWRTFDVGSLIEVNGGLLRITGYSSATVVNAVILSELTSAVGAIAGSWALLVPLWTTQRGYPKTCCFFQQRLWFANTYAYPQTMWGSRSGLYFDFTPGTADDDAVYKSASVTDDVNPLQFLCGAASLIMLGYSAEVEGKGGIEKPITPLNMQINAQSEWGSANVRPATVGKEILFVERGGTALRALFPQQVDGYDSTDVSVFSEHLLSSGVKAIAYERKPNSVLWVATNDGSLHAFTYNREQNTIAWASGLTDGFVESLATVPNGGQDVTDAVVRRTINGATVRNVERLDWSVTNGFYDSRIEQEYDPPQTVCDGFDALEGETVGVLADGVYVGQYTVTGGDITLDREASVVAAGLPYTAEVILQRPEVGTGTGTSAGQAMSTNRIQVRLHKSVGLKVNGVDVAFRFFDAPATLDNPPTLITGLRELVDIGWDDDDGQDLTLTQDQGLPWTVLSVIRTVSVNAG